jgi:hypothetical protein
LLEGKRQVGKLSRIKTFFRENSKKFLFTGVAVLIISVLALTPGIGYTLKIDITSSQPLVKGHPCVGYICKGTMNCDFNSLLYPVNHLFNNKISKNFIGRSDPYDSSGDSVKRSARTLTLISEFPANIPFYFVIGSIVAIGLAIIIKKIQYRRYQV